MTGNAIHTKTEALALHELSSENLDAVSGGRMSEAQMRQLEDKRAAEALRTFRQVLDSL